MPRFSDSEKEIIRQRLLTEGERLFSTLGLKKVTIDDLIHAVGIAKASFYTFYTSKEQLYMEIVQSIQKKLFTDVEELLEQNSGLPCAERVKQVFAWLYLNMSKYPILLQIDSSTVDYISRKLPPEQLADYQQNQFDAAQSLANHGVKFKCSVELASKAFQAVYYCWLGLNMEGEETQKAVIDLVLSGVIHEVVAD